ncbi:hypothetical protein D9758_005813 [Tetrapyrgos nigripes]|uniref:Heterokaryon incompatibility domain-containing protein n=1 Tax=Tetrapyrgos nigripes TaxID=182062 RepID=A0A8H5GK25_9AGAR|nr:hypothetical protein D9758_005813 [Tetrapyrgos nigripes]
MEGNTAKALPKRLVNTHTCRLVDFSENGPTPPYAILSHRWVLGEEVSYQDYLESRPETKKKLGYRKIQRACMQARADGFDYIWMDTICINQGNHDEVARNVNGMYSFYQHSEVCYAYLTDVYKLKDGAVADLIARMWSSGWFQRGWTLQELVAPRNVLFFSAGWETIGYRHLLKFGISRLTGIPPAVLDGSRPIEDIDIQERMTWCAGRQTTRPPDLAYCLMGILGVSMTPDYSEDARTAFKRLQIALVQSYPDRFMEFKGDDIYTMLLSQNMRIRVQSSYNESSIVTSDSPASPTSLDKYSLSPPKAGIGFLCGDPYLLPPILSLQMPSHEKGTTVSSNVSHLRSSGSQKVGSSQSGLMSPDLKYAVITRTSPSQTAGPRRFTGYPVSQIAPVTGLGKLETDDSPLPPLPAPTITSTVTARRHWHGSAPEVYERLTAFFTEAVTRRFGREADSLALAMRVYAASVVQLFDRVDTVERLLMMQHDDGSWKNGVYYRFPTASQTACNDGLTMALVIKVIESLRSQGITPTAEL